MKTTFVSIDEIFSTFSNFLTEAPGQYTGPSMGGLVTRGGGAGAGVMMPGAGQMQPGGPRTSE